MDRIEPTGLPFSFSFLVGCTEPRRRRPHRLAPRRPRLPLRPPRSPRGTVAARPR